MVLDKKEYNKPEIKDIDVILKDIIALSNNGVLGDIFSDDGERIGE